MSTHPSVATSRLFNCSSLALMLLVTVTRHRGCNPDVPSWCIHRVHVAWVLTGPNEWSQWIFSFKHMAATAGQLGASDLPPVSTGIRLRQMQEFGGCRRWPWPQSYHPSAFQMQLPRREIVSYHSLVSPLHARAFWYNADNLLKVGVRRSQGIVCRTSLSFALGIWTRSRY